MPYHLPENKPTGFVIWGTAQSAERKNVMNRIRELLCIQQRATKQRGAPTFKGNTGDTHTSELLVWHLVVCRGRNTGPQSGPYAVWRFSRSGPRLRNSADGPVPVLASPTLGTGCRLVVPTISSASDWPCWSNGPWGNTHTLHSVGILAGCYPGRYPNGRRWPLDACIQAYCLDLPVSDAER